MSYIHIKLDKFVAGDNKRIFKSSIKSFEDEAIKKDNIAYLNINENNKDDMTQVYYGNYYKLINIKQKSFLSNLIHFNKVLPKYVKLTDKVNFKLYTSMSNLYNSMFENNQENINLQVNYFKNIMLMPIDIAGVLNMAYMLSPFGKRKNILIVNPNFNIDFKNYNINADYKENYKEMYNYLFDRTTSNSLFNTIPLYDINLLHLDTITFLSIEKLNDFITLYKLENNISNIFCNINNKFGLNLIDSIKIHLFFKYAIANNIDIDKNLIKKLVDNISNNSFNNYFLQKGYISNLSNKTISIILNSLILSSYIKNGFLTFSNLLDEMYTKNTIPNNSLYLLDTQNVLSKDLDGRISAALNFVNLKNFQTPLEDFYIDVTLTTSEDFNKNVNKLFDEDKTKSLLFNIDLLKKYYLNNNNNENLIPTKKITLEILSAALNYNSRDFKNLQLSSYFEKINNNTLEKDKNDYLIPFYLYHTLNNKFLLIGLLNGIRNYLNIGILDLQDNIWISYKYITHKNEALINLFSNVYLLPFKSYDNRRNEKHMLSDYLGILYKGENDFKITKDSNLICPYIKYNKNLSSILCNNCNKIKLNNYSKKCLGYCSFPTFGLYYENNNFDIPHLIWNNTQYLLFNKVIESNSIFSNNNNQWFWFSIDGLNKCILKALTDIEVYDDILIYYSNMPLDEFNKYIETNQHRYDSIFEGFSKKYSILNNKNIKIKLIYKNVLVKNYFKTILLYTKLFLTITPTKKLGLLFNRKLKDFIDILYINKLPETIDKNIFLQNLYVLLYNNNFNYILNLLYGLIINGIKNIELGIFKGMSAFKFYYTNLYDIIKTIKLSEDLKIELLPKLKIKYKNKILYNDFVLENDTPFNGPHIIPAGTKLSGLKIYKKQDNSINIEYVKDYLKIEKDINSDDEKLLTMYCYIRVINWWSDIIKCTGKIKILSFNEDILNRPTYKKLNNIINNYDHILKIDGFFKSLQADYKKSNIYSIRVKNSNFSKNLDIDISKYHEYILLRNYAYLDEKTQSFYKFLTYELMLLLLRKTLSLLSFEYTILYKLYKANLPDSDLNIVLSFNNFYLIDKKEDKLNNVNIATSKMFTYIINQGGIYMLDKEYIYKLIKAKNDLREVFELTIKNSVHKYMPVHTDLWKIIYEN